MAKSKLLTVAVMSSALVLVACGNNTDTSEQGTTTTTDSAVEELTLDTTEEVATVEEVVIPDEVMDDTVEAVDGVYNELLDLTLVYFDFDKSDIRPEFRDLLDAHAAFLVAHPNEMVVLEGHADERGTREYNLALGERRAKQVAAYLQVKGVSAAQLDTVSYGEEKPLAIGKTESEYSQNRRVEIVYK